MVAKWCTATAPGKRSVIVNVNVSGQERVVGDNDVVAQLAVVGHVAAGHEKIMVADSGKAVLFFRGPVDGNALADDVMIADDHFGVAASIADVLRFAADHSAGINVIVTADGHMAHQGDAVFQFGSAADANVRPHNAVGADFHFVVDLGPGVDRRVFGDEDAIVAAPKS